MSTSRNELLQSPLTSLDPIGIEWTNVESNCQLLQASHIAKLSLVKKVQEGNNFQKSSGSKSLGLVSCIYVASKSYRAQPSKKELADDVESQLEANEAKLRGDEGTIARTIKILFIPIPQPDRLRIVCFLQMA